MQYNITINIDDQIIKRYKTIFKKRNTLTILFLILLLTSISYGDPITVPNYFIEGQVISADEINQNFEEVYIKVNELSAKVDNTSSSGFGDSVYKNSGPFKAETDGFVVAIGYTYGTRLLVYGYTDSNVSPTTMVACEERRFSSNTNEQTTITFPVKKGNYWKVSGAQTVRWVPFGN